jgi:hypothetical protein
MIAKGQFKFTVRALSEKQDHFDTHGWSFWPNVSFLHSLIHAIKAMFYSGTVIHYIKRIIKR